MLPLFFIGTKSPRGSSAWVSIPILPQIFPRTESCKNLLEECTFSSQIFFSESSHLGGGGTAWGSVLPMLLLIFIPELVFFLSGWGFVPPARETFCSFNFNLLSWSIPAWPCSGSLRGLSLSWLFIFTPFVLYFSFLCVHTSAFIKCLSAPFSVIFL